MHFHSIFVGLVGIFLASQTITRASELEALQGKWEARIQDQGKTLRVLKIIEKNHEIVETYDGDRLVHRHEVTLEEKNVEGITILHYRESEVTHGPLKGERGKTGSFISKRLGDIWYNVQGLETNSDTPFIVLQFKRVKEVERDSSEGKEN